MEIHEINILMDLYGELLTKKQNDVMNMHYNNDMSLAEIAETLEISRQGVHDNIKKASNVLEKYEDRLGLLKNFYKNEGIKKNIIKELSNIKSENDNSINKILEYIRNI